MSETGASLPRAHGDPPASGRLRSVAEDFQVDELLGFEPGGVGEHVLLQVEKTGANTEWVARQLARTLGVAPVAIGFAGLKDRHAVTRQTFSVQLPGRADPDWHALGIEGVRVLQARRHDRKLRRGAHRGNRFRIVVRALAGDRAAVDARMAAIAAHGVPNYFGEQRFGIGGGNVALALAMFEGRRVPREQRAIALSAARSELFNRALGERVRRADWNAPLDGDVWMLDGSHAIFGPEPLDDALRARVATGDIHPTGPMWGRGELRATGEAAQLERAVVDAEGGIALARGLEAAGLSQERRALRLPVRELSHDWDAPDRLVVAFTLDRGAFATSVLREVCETDAAMA